LKLEYDMSTQWNPRLIYADLTGFGEKGPDAALPDSISRPSGAKWFAIHDARCWNAADLAGGRQR